MRNFIVDNALLSIDQSEELSDMFITELKYQFNVAKIAVLQANQATEHAILANLKNLNCR